MKKYFLMLLFLSLPLMAQQKDSVNIGEQLKMSQLQNSLRILEIKSTIYDLQEELKQRLITDEFIKQAIREEEEKSRLKKEKK